MSDRGSSRARATSAHAKPRTLKLNPRQRKYLELLYQADQEAEKRQRRRWHQSLRREPAHHWRWIPFSTDHPRAGTTEIQQRLTQEGIHDPGSGATLSALLRRGLIEVRTVDIDTSHGTAPQRQVRLTRTGRQTVREALSPRNESSQAMPAWLTQALNAVRNAPLPGLPKTAISRIAARRLGPAGHHYIEDANAWAYKLTPEGDTYLDNMAAGPGHSP
jgi:hypothetical protein